MELFTVGGNEEVQLGIVSEVSFEGSCNHFLDRGILLDSFQFDSALEFFVYFDYEFRHKQLLSIFIYCNISIFISDVNIF